MTLEQAIDRYSNNSEYERRNGSLQGCMEFRQLAEWLKDYKRLLEQEPYICDTCKHKGDGWDTEPCDGCCGNHSGYEPCEDAISREELLKAIDTWDKFGYTETGCFVREPKGDYVPYIHYDDVIKCIMALPPVTPQQKYGKWEILACDLYMCPKCYAKYTFKSNYCPNCGAKMESEVEE